MAQEPENAVDATESAAKSSEKAVAEMTRAAERAAAERIGTGSRAFGGAAEAAFKAMQDYNAKLIQVFQTNTEANLQLGQTLMQARSPVDFIETMGKTMRERTELIASQVRELAALRQAATRSVIEAMAPRR